MITYFFIGFYKPHIEFVRKLVETFKRPCNVTYSYNENQRDALFLKFIW